jgi:hypothetical protein
MSHRPDTERAIVAARWTQTMLPVRVSDNAASAASYAVYRQAFTQASTWNNFASAQGHMRTVATLGPPVLTALPISLAWLRDRGSWIFDDHQSTRTLNVLAHAYLSNTCWHLAKVSRKQYAVNEVYSIVV